MDKKITGHMIVRNEDQFIWYAITSVLPYLDRLLIFDTGSDDKTREIIKAFKSRKIEFEEKGHVDAEGLINLRQKQIDKTLTDWIWIVDGDEIYPRNTAEKVVENSQNKDLMGIIVHRYDLLGDIYHYQSESIGSYEQFGRRGHYILRLINKVKIRGLQVLGNYPNEFFADYRQNSVKNYGKKYFAFVEERIFHAMYLQRSTRGKNLLSMMNRDKFKIELGKKIPLNELPEVFFGKHPDIVPDVTQRRGKLYAILAFLISPLKWAKRRIIL